MDWQRLWLGDDFTGSYLAVRRIAELAETRPEAVAGQTVDALGLMLAEARHAEKTQAPVLYRDAAAVLAGLTGPGRDPGLAARSLRALERALAAPGRPRMAAAEALGCLPLDLQGHEPEVTETASPPSTRLGDVMRAGEARADGPPPVFRGRTLVLEAEGDRLLAVKLLRQGEDPHGLALEAAWMEALAPLAATFPERCEIPRPLRFSGSAVIAVPDAPEPPSGRAAHGRQALAYLCPRDYFAYPNDTAPSGRGPFLDGPDFVRAMARSARLLGSLAGAGIIHEAAIPLFHNRVQRQRRQDAGLYDWRRLGRLDRWLESARHPNFGLSGPRDFEHLAAYRGPSSLLYKALGDHFLSLALVAGSYFRFKDPARVGLEANGQAVDARDLFDPELLAEVLDHVFDGYYAGFGGRPRTGPRPFDAAALAGRMIEEMGQDRHMVEMLRVADQEAMTDEAFRDFLVSRGMSVEEAAGLERGAGDVSLATGPHLGEFNGRVSLPELCEFAACAAAACVAGRHFGRSGGN